MPSPASRAPPGIVGGRFHFDRQPTKQPNTPSPAWIARYRVTSTTAEVFTAIWLHFTCVAGMVLMTMHGVGVSARLFSLVIVVGVAITAVASSFAP